MQQIAILATFAKLYSNIASCYLPDNAGCQITQRRPQIARNSHPRRSGVIGQLTPLVRVTGTSHRSQIDTSRRGWADRR
ncbi:hypothetical protein A5724_18010 [Mycobacterium sp. ACS1612]|nr:hypothetical protein A5724_18010 [Mycobacterium sp. ACS1612]